MKHIQTNGYTLLILSHKDFNLKSLFINYKCIGRLSELINKDVEKIC